MKIFDAIVSKSSESYGSDPPIIVARSKEVLDKSLLGPRCDLVDQDKG
jgi:hypothetical protein